MQYLTLYQLYQKMLAIMGPQGWWPADSKFEIILGAILVQNTNWKNVEKSLANIKEKTAYLPEKVSQLNNEQLIHLIRPSGFYKNKSKAIMDVFQWLREYNFDLEKIKIAHQGKLRQQLLSLHGIGEETADVLLLYVFDEKVFVADKYTQKLFTFLQVEGIKNYRSLKKLIPVLDNFSLEQAQEFHGLLDEFGKIYVKNQPAFATSFLEGYRLILTKRKQGSYE
ncbi:MAG: deoxyribonuclease I [Tetragenococcus halophilus]|uniref:endonuclease III domain-containing protein n=1 Tax=Tetragenococcus halophilus TaxID=51669 RepID=UPI00083D8462|nr:deoxyribonuclease I [Tetragenococcus halophilus]AOF48141.1 deoxyribonuclease I [Tetragenococcus halophilus]MCO7025794.1 deoxyribonuclease I [Tetragenococcus halophilus]MCO8283585.1 deoxyribonuclease I [Tetragenococcus halophilus]MCO8286871.1 deoxyribonuclease I [Tetragenococcus halophilus]MCO8288854.1 deoxyribonuclease I [Tetragenococcus halophilus]